MQGARVENGVTVGLGSRENAGKIFTRVRAVTRIVHDFHYTLLCKRIPVCLRVFGIFAAKDY